MDAIENLLHRRTIRKYTEQPVKDEDLQTIVKCGSYAATSRGRQAWRFTIVTDRSYLDEITAASTEVYMRTEENRQRVLQSAEKYDTFRGAPCAVIISGADDIEGIVDCADATENMALAAHALGLGSCYIGSIIDVMWLPEYRHLTDRLELPEGYKPYFALAVGYAAEDPVPEARTADHVNYIR